MRPLAKETLKDQVVGSTLDRVIEAVEEWKAAFPEWAVTEVHYFSTFNLAGAVDGWRATIEALRVADLAVA